MPKAKGFMTFKYEDGDVGPTRLWTSKRKAREGCSPTEMEKKLGLPDGGYWDKDKWTPDQKKAYNKIRGIITDYGWISVSQARRTAVKLGVKLEEV